MKRILCCLFLAAVMVLGAVAGFAESGYTQAPEMMERVAGGELPPVEERLPQDPLVVKALDGVGVYGGTWRQSVTGIHDTIHHIGYYGGTALVVWDVDGKSVVPNIASSYEVSEDAKVFTFTLRKDLKWSDGEPFSMEDIEFWWYGFLQNQDLTPSNTDFADCTFAVVDEYTFTLTFESAKPLYLAKFAGHSGQFHGSYFFRPAHYLKQFHPDYATEEEIKAALAKYGMNDWVTLFKDRADYEVNPDFPVMAPFVLTVDPAGTNTLVFNRNPYYWAVDEAGQQLPYLDQCIIYIVQTAEIAKLKIIAGEVDCQVTTISENFSDFPLLAEHAEEQGYTMGMFHMNEPNGLNFSLNITNRDETKRALLGNHDFRVALSQGFDRKQIIAAFWTVGPYASEVSQSAPVNASPYYSEEMQYQYTQLDVEGANALLDNLGMTQYDGNGYRMSPAGETFNLIVSTSSHVPERVEMAEIVAQQWRENLKLNIIVSSTDMSLWTERVNSNDYDISVQTGNNGFAMLDESAINTLTGYNTLSWGTLWQAGSIIWRNDPTAEGAVEPDENVLRLWEIGKLINSEPDAAKRDELAFELVDILKEGLYTLGIGRRPPTMNVTKNYMRNIHPDLLTFNWYFGVSGNTRPEAYWIDQAD